MITLRRAVLGIALSLVGGVLFSTEASACESDCRCSHGPRHHHHHEMMGKRHHMQHRTMHEGRMEHRHFAEDEDGRDRFFMRFHHRIDGEHERFDTMYGPHPHQFAMMPGPEECRRHMRWRGRMEMHHAWGGPDGMPPMAMEGREHRRRFDHDRDGEERHHRGFDPYRDNWDSRRDASHDDD